MGILNALVPAQASNVAGGVDALYFFIASVVAFFATAVSLTVVVSAIKFRYTHQHEVGHPVHGALFLELVWTCIPLAIALVMFYWGATTFFARSRPPPVAMETYSEVPHFSVVALRALLPRVTVPGDQISRSIARRV